MLIPTAFLQPRELALQRINFSFSNSQCWPVKSHPASPLLFVAFIFTNLAERPQLFTTALHAGPDERDSDRRVCGRSRAPA